MALLEISVVPVGTGTASFSSYVDDAVKLIEKNGLNYQVTPTATVIEGDVPRLMELAMQIHQNAMSNGASRIITNICIDERTDKQMYMLNQVQAVQDR
ncbi:hypothetical protein ADL26_20285 [Thermoactinomyces vulgaris]|jgi:uncharacterized protein (TIGR00106 family)|nr:hypothetical protein ADL26_20285 [Thermoactinomyces vulgaris]